MNGSVRTKRKKAPCTTVQIREATYNRMIEAINGSPLGPSIVDFVTMAVEQYLDRQERDS